MNMYVTSIETVYMHARTMIRTSQFHPDKAPVGTTSEAERAAATEKFQRINKAYELLSCAESRREYDRASEGGTQVAAGSEQVYKLSFCNNHNCFFSL